MAQNIYDNASFFAAYNTLPRSQQGLAGAPEWPALRSMILGSSSTTTASSSSSSSSKLKDAHVLDLGCGYGWFCRWAVQEGGAASVLGVDLSEMMLEKARRDWSLGEEADGKLGYTVGDLDEIELGQEEKYELVFSSLAFHYVRDVRLLFRKIYHCLKPGGKFVFSIEHPLFTAPVKPQFNSSTGDWTLNSYHIEGERWRDWLGAEVRKQHRSMTTYMEALLEPGFRLDAFKEWKPTEEEIKAHPDWEGELHRPIFLLMAASKDA